LPARLTASQPLASFSTTTNLCTDTDETAPARDKKKKYFTFHSVETSIKYMQSKGVTNLINN
jgi:hypothetical protein